MNFESRSHQHAATPDGSEGECSEAGVEGARPNHQTTMCPIERRNHCTVDQSHAESEETGENRLPIPEDPHQTVWEVMTIFTSSTHGVLQVLEDATLARGAEEKIPIDASTGSSCRGVRAACSP